MNFGNVCHSVQKLKSHLFQNVAYQDIQNISTRVSIDVCGFVL